MLNLLLKIWNQILLSNLFNFLLMLLLLSWIIKKFKIADIIENGRKSVEDKIFNAKQEKENAIKNLFETHEKGSKVEKTALEIIDKSSKNAVLVGEKLIEDANKLADSYSETTKKIIDSNIEKLRLNLSNETAQEAVDLAKKHIVNNLKKDRSLHIKYINESIDALKGINIS